MFTHGSIFKPRPFYNDFYFPSFELKNVYCYLQDYTCIQEDALDTSWSFSLLQQYWLRTFHRYSM
jgi:hypothetical protein